jgi:hypothetical protein
LVERGSCDRLRGGFNTILKGTRRRQLLRLHGWSAICRAATRRVARMPFLFRSVDGASDVTSLDEPRAVNPGLRRGSAVVRLLGLWVRISPGAWVSVSCGCCVLSGRGLCIGPITRTEESYRVWCL